MNSTKVGAIVYVALMAFAFPVQSQELPLVSGSKQMAAELQRVCPATVKEMGAEAILGPALSKRPIKSREVCKCAEGEFSSDKRLQEFLTVDALALQQRVQSEHLKSYVALRLMQSILVCLSADMELSLRSTSPAE